MRIMGIILGLIVVQSSFAFECDSTRRAQAIKQSERLRLSKLEFTKASDDSTRTPTSIIESGLEKAKSLLPDSQTEH